MSIKEIVDNNLCTGCGVCISEDRNKSTNMIWNKEGFYIPDINDRSDVDNMDKVCPFSLRKENLLTEDELGTEFIKDALHSDLDIGLYSGLYAGYSSEFRESSSSGGIATFVFENLLKNNHVEHLFIVREFEGRYAYQIFNDSNKIKEISKTRYYPVTMASLFEIINTLEGRVAVSGVACFIKAIRLKQHYSPELKEKIPFLIGIICGGLKSKYYTDFLAQSAGCHSSYKNAEYRVKNPNSFALDYKFTCVSEESRRINVVDMQSLGDMWGTGLFKSNACDFCDDVVTELADISLGDAWIPPYNQDGAGNSIIITRTKTAEQIIQKGVTDGLLRLDILNLPRIKSSQQGSFNHRHKGMLFRIQYAKRSSKLVPIKRNRFLVKQNIYRNIIQYLRMKIRSRSLTAWIESKNIKEFNGKMKGYLFILRKITLLGHWLVKIKRNIKI